MRSVSTLFRAVVPSPRVAGAHFGARLAGAIVLSASAALIPLAVPAASADSEAWSRPSDPIDEMISSTSSSSSSIPRATQELRPWMGADACARCHQIDRTFSHPVNFAPSRSLPSDFPLDQGMLTCTTCHDMGARHMHTNDGPALRTNTSGSAFCAQCHDSTNLNRADMHSLVLGVAHTRLARDTAHDAPPDFESSTCLTCHDGSLVTNITHRSLPGADFAEGTHPFDVEYRLSDPEAFDGPLAPQGSLDHRIRIVRDRVDCGSCHSLYSPLDKLLVMENRASTLCLNCHQY